MAAALARKSKVQKNSRSNPEPVDSEKKLVLIQL